MDHKYFIIWLANFACFDWSIPGPITYGTGPDGLVKFAFFCFCFICTLFELVILTNEIANHFGFDKESLGLEIRLFATQKRSRKTEIITLPQKLKIKTVNNNKLWTCQFKYFCYVFKNTIAVEQAVLYNSFDLDNRQWLTFLQFLHQLFKTVVGNDFASRKHH